MPTLAELIYVWGMAGATLLIPTGLVAMWAINRGPQSVPGQSQTADRAPPPATDMITDRAA